MPEELLKHLQDAFSGLKDANNEIVVWHDQLPDTEKSKYRCQLWILCSLAAMMYAFEECPKA
jgi:hypothetical protein